MAATSKAISAPFSSLRGFPSLRWLPDARSCPPSGYHGDSCSTISRKGLNTLTPAPHTQKRFCGLPGGVCVCLCPLVIYSLTYVAAWQCPTIIVEATFWSSRKPGKGTCVFHTSCIIRLRHGCESFCIFWLPHFQPPQSLCCPDLWKGVTT